MVIEHRIVNPSQHRNEGAIDYGLGTTAQRGLRYTCRSPARSIDGCDLKALGELAGGVEVALNKDVSRLRYAAFGSGACRSPWH